MKLVGKFSRKCFTTEITYKCSFKYFMFVIYLKKILGLPKNKKMQIPLIYNSIIIVVREYFSRLRL